TDKGPIDGKSPVVMRRMPGVKALNIAGTGHAGSAYFNGAVYSLSRNRLYRLNGEGFTNLGGIAEQGRAQFASNGIDLAICVGNVVYFTDGITLTRSDIRASSVASLNGYYFFILGLVRQIK
ncbi:MAG: hypothetical protein AAF734_10830, partial [Bacteroidota bacterium]